MHGDRHSAGPAGLGDEAFAVVVNHEGQHSIWPAGRPLPAGWSHTGAGGDREECVAYIERVWTDMRPRSLRRRRRHHGGMEAGGR